MTTIGVVGANGGAGASTVAAALAAGARGRGRSVVLAELDTCGGGLDVHLGIEQSAGPRWPDLLAPGDPAIVVADLPSWRGVSVVSADRLRPVRADADGGVRVDQVLTVLGDSADVVVLDAGRAPAPGRSAIDACTGVVLVVPRNVRGVAGGIAALGALVERGRVGVLDRAGGPLGRLEVAHALGVVAWGSVPDDRGVAAAIEHGEGPPGGLRTRLGAWVAETLDTGPIAALCGTRP